MSRRSSFGTPGRRLAVLAALACAVALLSVPTLGGSADAAARPARVSGVRLAVGADRIKVYWHRAKRATRYRVLVSGNTRMTSARVYRTRSRSITVPRINPARSYCVQIQGVRGKRTLGRRSQIRCSVPTGATPWVDQQALERTTAGTRTRLRLRWPARSQAIGYQIDFAPSPTGGIVDVQRSTRKRTVAVAAAGSGLQAASIGGLTPGTTYCFQVRGAGRAGYGLRSTRRCKVTMSAGRPRPAQATPLVVGTFNTCSNACPDWRTRRPLVTGRVQQMQLDGRAADVVAIQEGYQATDALAADLAGTFVEGCRSEGRLQSLFVRAGTYEVLANTAGSIGFGPDFNDPSHGACWVRVKSRDTGQEVIVVSLHLLNGTSADAVRGSETQRVIDQVTAAAAGAPIVFAGDFNSHRSRAIDAPRIRLAGIGAEDGYDQAASYQSLPYLNSACAGPLPCASWLWGDHIDRVFAGPGIHVAAWKVDYRMRSGRYLTPAPSDHNPVLVSLRIPVTG